MVGPNPVDVHVGARLRARRVELGISQERLGESLGFAAQQIQKYERAANRISASKLFEIADVLQVPVAYFFEGLPSKHLPRELQLSPEAREALANQDVVLLVESFAQVEPGPMRRQLVELVKAMAGQARGSTPRRAGDRAPD